MKTAVKRLYEGMFLVDSAMAASDWNGVLSMVEGMLKKHGAEIVSMRKWDERKLAYPIERKTRGTYILVYFNLDTDKVTLLERDIVLSEKVMRAMILRTDAMSQEDMDRETPAMVSEREGRTPEVSEEPAEQETQEQQPAQEQTSEEETSEDSEEAQVEESKEEE